MSQYLRYNHPSATVLPEPINVSPLIRFARWSALGVGILWGAYRLRQISEYHADIREFEFERKSAKAREKALQKKWLAKDEMRYLFKAIGIPFEEGVSQTGIENLYREN